MDPKLVKKIASLGGKAISQDRARMQRIGKIGGQNSHRRTNGKAREEA